nr:hypothetical protein [uncultured Carboxylicivirga sp.]
MKKLAFAVITSVLVLTACNKNENLVPIQTIEDVDLKMTTESVVTTDATLEDVVEATEYEVDLYSGTSEALSLVAVETETPELKFGGNDNPFRYRYRNGVCPNVNVDSENGTFPKIITIDYGDSTVLNNGRVISGIITIEISAPRTVSGATRTITFESFTVDSISIDGVIVKTFLLDEYTISITRNLTFTLPDGTTITIESERTKVWVEGMDTPFIHEDDVFEITGYSLISDSDGDEFKKEITVPLIKTGDCRYIVSGEVTLSQNEVVFAVIDYGDGTCDNIATYTTADGTTEFIIGQKVRDKKYQNTNN